jgi:uncharacterized protein YjiS (DUF1127 family)
MTANPTHPAATRTLAAAQGSLFAKVHDVVSSTVGYLKEELAIRRAMRELEQLDDHALKDIGLQRGEIEGRVRTAFGSRS